MNTTRRQAMLSGLFGVGGLGLRALATGLPAWFLADPRRAAAAVCPPSGAARALIVTTAGSGDPLNANTPGTFDFPDIYHSADPQMAPTPVQLGGKTYTVARPWAQLDPQLLAQTSFLHHGTYTINHGNHPKVLRLMGAVKRQEMLLSLIARNLAPCLGTVQAEPAVLSSNLITYQGRVLPVLSPPDLRSVLAAPDGPLTKLQALRDQDMDRLNALLKKTGTAAQRAILDAHANSQREARALSQQLLDNLAQIKSSTRDDLNIGAAVLIKMNVTPVVVMGYSWGGDNHGDLGLASETANTVASVAAIGGLFGRLRDLGIADKVVFMAQNVFGRTLSRKVRANGNTDGRDHHGNHHCTVLIGDRIRGGVIGGLELKGIEYQAQAIDSKTGAGGAGGDIAFADTLGAVGKTVAAACGLDRAVIDDQITQGKVISAAING